MSFEFTAVPSLAAGYHPLLDVEQTEQAIAFIKGHFECRLAQSLGLRRVTAPLLLPSGSGINDDLNGVEAPVRFRVKALAGQEVEVVQSLAKWKRLRLSQLGLPPGRGLYADMNALRPDDALDALHSVYVDQWDWEKTIGVDDRRLDFLKTTVRTIYTVVRETEMAIAERYPVIQAWLPAEVTFVHAEDLERRHPDLTPAQREHRVAQEHGAVFVIGIGAALPGSGEPHDGRAPDYDDWITPNGHGLGLNGDLIVWYPPLARSVELSSMGIRVSPESLERQLQIRGCSARRDLFFHRQLLAGRLPLSIGGGIGQSRLCLCFLRKLHIGEVQAGVWPEETRRDCQAQGIPLL